MILRIRTSCNKCYDSVCFGIIDDGWKELAIVFNEEQTNLILVPFWLKKEKELSGNSSVYAKDSSGNSFVVYAKVFYVDASDDDWAFINKNLKGIEWIVKNDDVMSDLSEQKQVDTEILEKAKLYDESLQKSEFHEIKNEKDAKNAFACSSGLHDAFLREILEDEKFTTFVFDTTWGFDFILKCETEFLEYNLTVNNFAFWYQADFEFKDDALYLEGEVQSDEIEKGYIKSKNSSFSIVVQNLDEELFSQLSLM